jgi:hypothetical protein
MLTYRQSTGSIERNGKPLAAGYSGGGLQFMNRPLFQQFEDHGPVPRGIYRIEPVFFYLGDLGHKGYVMHLHPIGHSAEGRDSDSFFIHGDSVKPDHEGHASHGCIVLPLEQRQAVWESNDQMLRVMF